MKHDSDSFAKKLFILDDKKMDVRPQTEALRDADIPFKLFTSINELLDEIEKTDPRNIGGISLDLQINAPANVDVDEGSRKKGGRWVCQEVVKETSNAVVADPAKAKSMAKKGISFLTSYPNDPVLLELKEDLSEQDRDLPIFDKDDTDVAEYVEWARDTIQQDDLFEEYYDASLAACRLMESLGFKPLEIVGAFGGSAGSIDRRIWKSDDLDVWKLLSKRFPPERCLSPQDSITRWNIIIRILARTFAVFNNDAKATMTDINLTLSDFGERSTKEVISGGDFGELVKLENFIERRWRG